MATPLPLQHSRSPFLSPVTRIKPKTFSQNPNPNTRFAKFTILCSPSSSSWEREEARWLREEQRWLREEQRWLREEARWREDRERLLAEIGMLRLKLEMMEKERLTDVEAVVTRPRPVLVEKAAVKEMLLEEAMKVEEEVKEVREVGPEQKREPEKKNKREKRSLRVGSEGDDVRALQEALAKLGFYCGEEDMEFSSFSSGTERAVKTWQATLGTREDGIMTVELLDMLFSEKKLSNAHEGVNGTAVASVAQVAAEIEKTVVKESSASNSGVDVSQHRVFLLGENRWEEPSRLVQKNNKQVIKSSGPTGTKCLSCRGEGRLMCTECDGTGEPNIEPQFLEWVDEGTKCPYCEGLGYTICDVCEGKMFIQN